MACNIDTITAYSFNLSAWLRICSCTKANVCENFPMGLKEKKQVFLGRTAAQSIVGEQMSQH